MKKLIVLALLMCGCTTDPTPFVAGDKVQPITGCQMLRQDIEKYNRENHTNLQADC